MSPERQNEMILQYKKRTERPLRRPLRRRENGVSRKGKNGTASYYGGPFGEAKGPGLRAIAQSIMAGNASIFHAAMQIPTSTTRTITN